MQTLKFKYTTDPASAEMIRAYRKQYASALRFAFNRRSEDMSEKGTESALCALSNIPLIKSFLRRCAVKNASQVVKSCEDDEEHKTVIFGGRANFIARAKGKITKEEFTEKRLSKVMVIGEANQRGNRLVRINPDLNSFTFTPERGKAAVLTIAGGYRRFKPMLRRLHELQESKAASITYLLDNEYICVTFDETIVHGVKKTKAVRDRVFAIDLNPNYVGWSVTDWRDGNDFTVVGSGVVSIKAINDEDFALKGKGFSSGSKRRLYLGNKRSHEVFEISKLLVAKAVHYGCGLFAIEELKMESGDKGKGAKYNKLVNNLWNRNKLVDNLRKRCALLGVRLKEVLPQYSSFIGNFLYRDLRLPDMVLASLEIARRCYEFEGQYVTKTREQRKNIVLPVISDFADRYAKSTEEFGVPGEVAGLVEIYEYLKESGRRYRLSLEELKPLRFSRCFSVKSKVVNVFTSFDNLS